MKNIKKVKKMDVLILILTCVIIGVFGQLLMKKGMNSIGNVDLKELFSQRIFSIVFQRYVFIGIALYILASIIWLAVLSKAELSFAYPLIGIGYIFTSILAWLFFGEKLTLIRVLGILLICSGVYLIVLKL
jgi:multidrug transporter EmrE-like cation transporter